MKKINNKAIIPFVGLILIIMVFTIITSGKIMTFSNLKLILEQSIILIVACVGVTFVMSMGSLDFSQGSMLAFCCVVAATVAQKSPALSIVAALVTGTIIGIINGVLVSKAKIPSFIVTICTLFILRGFTVFFTRTGAIAIPFEMNVLDNVQFKLLVLGIVLLVGFYLFTYTKFGRQCRAIGSGEISAVYSGLNVKKIKIIAFAFAGLLCGVSSFLLFIRTGVAAPTTGQLFETDVLTALVLGGMPITGGANSKIRSGIIGSLMLAFLGNGLVLMGASASILQIIKGSIFLAAVWISQDREGIVVIK